MSVLKGLGMIALAVSLTACAGNSADVGASFASETVDIYREIKVLHLPYGCCVYNFTILSMCIYNFIAGVRISINPIRSQNKFAMYKRHGNIYYISI